MARWRVDIIRKRAEHLGTVEAATEKEAIEQAQRRSAALRRSILERAFLGWRDLLSWDLLKLLPVLKPWCSASVKCHL